MPNIICFKSLRGGTNYAYKDVLCLRETKIVSQVSPLSVLIGGLTHASAKPSYQ